jgi:C-terminal processing protease CtpA/Prc
MKILLLSSYLVLCSIFAQAQQINTLKQTDKKAVIDSLCMLLNTYYVSAEKATQITNTLQTNFKNGSYDKLNNPNFFTDAINATMRLMSQDKHLNLAFDPEGIKAQLKAETKVITTNESENLQKYLTQIKRQSYGFKEIKMLEGNVGYLRIDDFFSPNYAAETAIAALNFLSSSEAIIFDMRYNKGGDASMIQVIISQLYKKDTTIHLNSFYHRATNTTSEMFTIPNLKGNKMPEIPVYVLTSKETFSAAEALAYDLQSLKRATIIGEVTAGGANAGNTAIVTQLFTLFLPSEKTINPITKTNWEVVGVIPDVITTANNALEKAHIIALENLVKSVKNIENSNKNNTNNSRNNKEKELYQWTLDVVKAKQNLIQIPSEKLKSFVGVYGVRTLSIENNTLYYQRAGKPKIKLIPLNENTFVLSTTPDIKIKMISENNKITAILMTYQDGGQDNYERN